MLLFASVGKRPRFFAGRFRDMALFFHRHHGWRPTGKYLREFFMTHRAANFLEFSALRRNVVFVDFQLRSAYGTNTADHVDFSLHFYGSNYKTRNSPKCNMFFEKNLNFASCACTIFQIKEKTRTLCPCFSFIRNFTRIGISHFSARSR